MFPSKLLSLLESPERLGSIPGMGGIFRGTMSEQRQLYDVGTIPGIQMVTYIYIYNIFVVDVVVIYMCLEKLHV